MTTTSAYMVYKRALKLMGNHFEFSVVAEEEQWAYQQIEAGIREVQRIEKLLTTFSETSETNLINLNAGATPVVVSQETFDLLQRFASVPL